MSHGQLHVVQWALRSQEEGGGGLTTVDLRSEQNAGLRGAMQRGHLDILQWALRPQEEGGGGLNTTDLRPQHNQALRWALESAHVDVVQWALLSCAKGGGGMDKAEVSTCLYYSPQDDNIARNLLLRPVSSRMIRFLLNGHFCPARYSQPRGPYLAVVLLRYS